MAGAKKLKPKELRAQREAERKAKFSKPKEEPKPASKSVKAQNAAAAPASEAATEKNSRPDSVKHTAAKAAGLKSTFVLSDNELLMTSFGKGNDAIREKYIKDRIVTDIANTLNVKPQEQFCYEISGRGIDAVIGDPLASFSNGKKPGDDLIGARSALELRFFGRTFEDNIHIQIIYNILDIKKILAFHANNIVYTLDNLARRDRAEYDDFIGVGHLCKNKWEVFIDPSGINDDDIRNNINRARAEFSEYYQNKRLAYYGDAFYVKRGKNSSDKNAQGYVLRPEKEVYYILFMMSALRQYCFHDSDKERAALYDLDKHLPPDALALLNDIYKKKIGELGNFAETASKSNYSLIFEAFHADTDEKKTPLITDFYDFTMRKDYKNTGFSVRTLREAILDQYAQEYRDKKYDSVRSKLYQLMDFFIWETYQKDDALRDALINSLRTRDKNTQREDIYKKEAEAAWKRIRSMAEPTADKLLRFTDSRSENHIDIRKLDLRAEDKELDHREEDKELDHREEDKKLDLRAEDKELDHREEDKKLVKKAINSYENRISEDASTFSKLIYLTTLFLDGKEINDLLTTLYSKFDNIRSLVEVAQANDRNFRFSWDYRFFKKSAKIADELHVINSFARMSKEMLPAKRVMFSDAAVLLGIKDISDNELEEYLANNVLGKPKLKRLPNGKPDTGLRNFIINNVIKSSRFRYLVRYGNPKKLRALMNNPKVPRFVLSELPDAQLDRYCAACFDDQLYSREDKIARLTKRLTKLDFSDFRNVEQRANAEKNRHKEKSKAIVSLYLYVLYQLIKNLVYVNSRYVIAFQCLERDAQLLGSKAGDDHKGYEMLTASFIAEKKQSKEALKNAAVRQVRTNDYALDYLEQNLKNAQLMIYTSGKQGKDGKPLETSALWQYRNNVAHLSAVRNANLYIGQIKEIESYYALYHYLMQCTIQGWYKKLAPEYVTKAPLLDKYFKDVEKFRSYSKDLVKALNIPFGYNLPRYKNLSIDGLFDMNRPGEPKEAAKASAP